MPAFSLFRSNKNSNFKNRKSQKVSGLGYEKLEPKNLLAGIFLDGSELVVVGGSGNDVGSVVDASSTTVTARLSGEASQTFDRSDVTKVVFIGFEGNDRFTNSTSINSNLVGNDGDDVLIGGSGADVISGGRGNDTLTGNDGNDRLVGFEGDDIARGGDGNDVILGGDGENRLFGDGQDDLIFGGADVDELSGGDGADVLIGLGSDDILNVGNGGTEANRDLALGFDGNDQFTGGTGVNVLYGGEGNDVFRGGSGVNRLFGQNGNDTLTGGSSADLLAGANGDDVIAGAGGNDYILPGQGDDQVNAGSGNDIVALPADVDDYKIFRELSTTGVSGQGQGSDRLIAVETFGFLGNSNSTNFVSTASTQASKRITIRPIAVAESNGSNRGNFFGSAAQELEVKLLIDETYAAADVDISWQAVRNWNNSSAKLPNTTVAALESLTEAGDAAGFGSTNPTVIDMYFLNQSPGSTSSPDLSVNGFAFLDFSGVAFYNGDGLASTDNPEFRELTALIAAHEISHNLGLTHVTSQNNLQNPSPTNDNLTSGQIATIRASQFSKDV